MLGWWSASTASVERDNHTHWTCGNGLLIKLECAGNNELAVRWRYRCGDFTDWFYTGNRRFAVNGENLSGQDGHIKADNFFWDGLIAGEGGSKIEMKLTGPDSATIEIGEDPKHFYPENTFRATLKRIPENSQIFDFNELVQDGQFHGKWTGRVRLLQKNAVTGVVEAESFCNIPLWEVQHARNVFTQKHIYVPGCKDQRGEDFNYWVGPHFFREDKVYDYKRNNNPGLEVVGTIAPGRFTRQNPYYRINHEDVSFSGNEMTYKLISKVYDMTRIPFGDVWMEYWLELKRAN